MYPWSDDGPGGGSTHSTCNVGKQQRHDTLVTAQQAETSQIVILQ
jgi:hypothetical protein